MIFDIDALSIDVDVLDQTRQEGLPLLERADSKRLSKLCSIGEHALKRDRCSVLRVVPLVQLVEVPLGLLDLITEHPDTRGEVLKIEQLRL